MAISPSTSSIGQFLLQQQALFQAQQLLGAPGSPVGQPSANDLFTGLLNATQQARQAATSPNSGSSGIEPGPIFSGGQGIVSNLNGINGVTVGVANIQITSVASAAQIIGTASTTAATALQGDGSFTILGPSGSTTVHTSVGETVAQLIQQINGSNIGVTASVSATGALQVTSSGVGSSQSITISNASGSDVAGTLGLSNTTATGTDATATVNGVTYTGQGNQFTIGGLGAGSLAGLQFTAQATGSTQVSVTASASTFDLTAPVTATTPAASTPFDLAQASSQLVSALLLQQFSLFSLQQQSFAYGLQGMLL